MERLREARRGSAVGVNGAGIARRRPRSDEEGALEMPESTASRLRDRASKQDRDRERERLSHGKRRRESLAMHDGDESSEESLADEDEEEEEDEISVPTRVHNPSTSNASPANHHHHHNNNNHHQNHGSGNSNSNQNHGSNHHQQQQQQRKNFPRVPAKWRADEMIGVPVPRKARTSSAKRTSNEWLESAQRQASASPSRMSPASTSQQISPSSSNASLRKKMKPMAGSKQPRPPPPKVSSNSNSNLSSKPSYFIQEEIEVAEVLFGLTRQFKQEHSQKHESKDQIETKSAAGTPHQSFPVAHEPIIAPKRKRPRSLKEEEGQVSLPSTSKLDNKSGSEIKAKFKSSSPKREKNADKNEFQSVQNTTELDRRAESEKKANNNSSVQEFKPESDRLMNRMETKEQNFLPMKESPKIDRRDESSTKIDLLSDGTREPKFSIDLMAPPERDDFNDSDHKAQLMCPPDSYMGVNNGKRKEDEKLVRLDLDAKKVDDSKKMSLDLQLDLEKPGNEIMVPTRATEKENQQLKSGKVESRQDNRIVPRSSVPMPMTVGGWPGNLPPFGFMSQVPTLPAGLVPMPSNPNSSSNLPARVPMLPSPIPRPKRCGTHCYIAQLISYHQRLAKINPFWPPAPATTPPVYGAPRPFGLIPPVSDARSLDVKPAAPAFNAAAEEKVGPQSANNVINNSGNVNSNNGGGNSNLVAEQRKQQQMAIQQQVQTGPMGNMMPGVGPAFFFPVNPQQVAAMAAAANRNPPTGGPTPSAASSAPAGVTPPMNMSFAGLPPGADPAQFLAILQNGAYPYPVPAGANAAGQAAYRGPPGQPMPFFNGPFYPPQMMQAAHQTPHQQPGSAQTQNQQPIKTGVSSSSSSQKNQQQQIHIQDLSSFNDKPAQDNNNNNISNNNRVMNQPQKGIYGHNFSLPMHPQNFAFMSPASSASQSQPQSQSQLPDPKPVDHPNQPSRNSSSQNQRIDLAQSQPFAMPFGSFNGPNVGLDFSSMVQPHPMFQNHEATRQHGYFPAPSPPAGAPSKSASGDSTSTNDRKSNNNKNNNNLGSGSLSFSKRESNNEQNQNPSSVPSNTSGGDNGNNNSSSRTLNLIPAYRDGHNSGSSRTGNSNPALSTTSSSTIPANMSGIQQQSIMHQMQKQVQQQVQQQVHQQLQQQMSQQQMMAQHFASRPNNNNNNNNNNNINNNNNNNNRSNNMSGFPSLMNFPQSQMQSGTGNNSPSHSHSQSPQWKQNPSSRSGTPIPGSTQTQNPGSSQIQKSNFHLHPTQNRTLPFSPHQTQISFGGGSNTALKTVQSQPGGPQEINRSLAAAMANPQKSGSPGPVSGSEPGPGGNNSSVQQQVGKNGSGSKPGPAPSILGQPNLGQAQSQHQMKSQSQHQMKSQSQHQMKQQQQQQQQQMSQHQLLFSNYTQQQQGNISMKPHKSPAQQQNTGNNNNNNVNSNNTQGGPTLVRMPTHGMMTNQGGTGGGQRVAGSFPYNMPLPPVSVSGKNVSEQKPNAAGGN